MTDAPSPGELSRRIDSLASDFKTGFADLNTRLNDFPTEKTLLALLQGQQAEQSAHLRAVRDDVRGLTAELANERADRKAADKDAEDRATAKISALEDRLQKGRTLAWSITGVVAAIFIGAGGFIITGLGGGA